MIEPREIKGSAERHGGGSTVQEVDASLTMMKGELAGGTTEVDEPGRFVVGAHESFRGGSGRVAVDGADEGGTEGGEVLRQAWAVPEESVVTFLGSMVFGIPEFSSAGPGGVAVEPAMTNDPAFGGHANPFGVAEEVFGRAVTVEGGLTPIVEPFPPFGSVGGGGTGRVTVAGRPVDGVDQKFFMVSRKVVEVVLPVNRTKFSEERSGVSTMVDDVTEEDEVMGFWRREGEGPVEAGKGTVEVGDRHRRQMVRSGHRLILGVPRPLAYANFDL